MKKYLSLMLFLFLQPLLLYADPVSDLISKLSNFQTFEAKFTQKVYSDAGVLLQTSSGRMVIQRPDHFYWQIQTPLEQVIVGTPTQVEIYEPDLQQVIVKNFSEDDPSEVFLWLLANPARLKTDFTVTYQAPHYILTAHQKNPLFSHIAIDFKNQQLAKIILKSTIGQITTVEFSHIQINPELPKTEFNLNLPKGVDVLHE